MNGMRAAQRTYDNAYPYDDEAERADEMRDEAIAELLDDPKWREAHEAIADDDLDGTFDGEHYSAVERALRKLAAVPADKLIGSDALATVLHLADVHGKAHEVQLRVLAEQQVDQDAERRRAA